MEWELWFWDSEVKYNNLLDDFPPILKSHEEVIPKTYPFKFWEMWMEDEKFPAIRKDALK